MSKYFVEDLRLFQNIEKDGIEEVVEITTFFDYADLDFESIGNDAQQRVLNLVNKRQRLEITQDELMQCFLVPFLKALGEYKNYGK